MTRTHLRPLTDVAPRAIIYLRQSVHRDDSISLELQEIACRDYCDRMGYEVVRVEADPGISGRTWNRPAVQRVMDAVDARNADVIVLWKWSRLSRSRKDWALAIDRADLAGGRIESATEPIDTATASGRFARGVMTEYAAFQSEQIGEQWEEVRQRRLNLGLPASGRLPYGWAWESGTVKPHPEQAPLVVEMYRRYLSGDGSAAIAAWLNSQGVPAPNGGLWRRARPLVIMDSPIHAGLIPYRNATYPGQHEPIIDAGTWERYREERARRRETKVKPREYAYVLSMIMTCECGARMHGKGSVTDGRVYRGYLCGSTLNGHPQRAYVSALTVEPPIVAWVLALSPEVQVAPTVVSTARYDAALREINDLEIELVKLTRQHNKGIVSEVAYTRSSAVILDELRTLQESAARLAPKRPVPVNTEALATLHATWEEATVNERNRMLRDVIASVKVLDGGRSFEIRTTWGELSVVHV